MNNMFKGVMPAMITPLKDDETVNVKGVEQLTKYLIGKGAAGFYIGGATGEGLLMSKKERMNLAESSCAAIGPDKTKIIHIAAMNFQDTLDLARHAEQAGADAISAVPPIYFGYSNDDIYNYYKEIAAQVHIPLMIYYTPAAAKTITTDLFKKLFDIDNITAVKWTVPDYFSVINTINAVDKDITVINGPDEMLVCGLAAGCAGGIGTTYNIQLPLIKKIYEAFTAGNVKEALELQKKADKVICQAFSVSMIPAVKAILEDIGIEAGPSMRPLRRYTLEEKKEIVRNFKAAGLEY